MRIPVLPERAEVGIVIPTVVVAPEGTAVPN
jgi:hypothetical protein